MDVVTLGQASLAARKLAPGVDRLHVFGHSYAEGYTTFGYPSTPFNRYSSLLARRLGAEEVNHACSGSEAKLNQRDMCGRVNNRVQPGPVASTRSLIQLALVQIGANDLGNSANYSIPSLFPALVTNALRRMRAAVVWESEGGTSDTALTFAANGGSAWTSSSSSNYKSGATSVTAGKAQSLNSVNAQFTLAIPATFQGGTVHIVGFHVGAGAVFGMTVDGSAATAWDTTAVNSGSSVYPDVYTLTGLAAGAHTIVGTCTTYNSGVFIDYAMKEAPNPPGILLLNIMDAPTMPVGPGSHTPITSSDRATFNGYLQTVAASFADGMVKYVPLTLDTAVSAYWGDASHPSDLGHELIEAQIWAFLQTTGWLGKLPRPKGATRDVVARLHIAGHFDDSAADRVTLVAGTATLNSRAITANTRAVLTRVGTNANAGHLYYSVGTATTTGTPGTMTIASSNVADTSVVDVLLYEAVNQS